MTIKDIQRALAALGYTPGAVDGVWGRQTAAAVRTFQSRHGLEPDGVVGPITLAKLFPTAAAPAAGAATGDALDDPGLVWFQEARRLIGTRETPGAGNNPKILDWAGQQGIAYGGDDIPWCGLFVGHCVTATLDREPTPTGVLSARAWQSFGIKTPPTPGAVMVFWRKSLQSGLGHVGFYAGEDKTAYRILGGNQSDSVSLAWIKKDRLVGARWPATIAPPVPQAIEVARNDTLSWNEA
jgi:uncharacterized protein (TIGR02594 family)